MTESELIQKGNQYLDRCTQKKGFIILPDSIRKDLIDMYVAGALDNGINKLQDENTGLKENIKVMQSENAELKIKVEELNKSNDELSDALGRGNDILEQKVKINILLRERLDNATDIIKKLLENMHIAENLFSFTSQSAIKADKFLEELEK